MATKTLRGKCPRCCPDGGACFTDQYDGTKKCNNCHLSLPRRTINRKPEGPNATQQRVIAGLVEAFGGGEVKTEMIGRKVWVSIKNEGRAWFNGTLLYGTVGPAGAYDLKLPRTFGADVKITDAIGVDVYLRSGKPKETKNDCVSS